MIACDMLADLLKPEVCIQKFNKYNINLILDNDLGWTAAHVLAVRGAWRAADDLLKIGLNPDKTDKFGWSARQFSDDMHGADIFNGGRCVVKEADTYSMGMTPCHVLAISGKPCPIIKMVADDTSSFHVKDAFGNTPLDYLDMLHGDGNFYRRLISIRGELDEMDKQ